MKLLKRFLRFFVAAKSGEVKRLDNPKSVNGVIDINANKADALDKKVIERLKEPT